MSAREIAITYRTVVTANGQAFEVPQHIIRVDDVSPPCWQLRYGEWTDYPDRPGDPAGTGRALQRAIVEMKFRIDTLGK